MQKGPAANLHPPHWIVFRKEAPWWQSWCSISSDRQHWHLPLLGGSYFKAWYINKRNNEWAEKITKIRKIVQPSFLFCCRAGSQAPFFSNFEQTVKLGPSSSLFTWLSTNHPQNDLLLHSYKDKANFLAKLWSKRMEKISVNWDIFVVITFCTKIWKRCQICFETASFMKLGRWCFGLGKEWWIS